MKFNSLLLAASLVVFGTAQSASALTFNFTGATSTQSSFSVLGDDGLTTLTVTGFTSGGSKNIHRDSNGVGVYQGGSDSTQTDGDGADETIRFTFNSGSFTLLSAQFENVGSDDDFTLTVDNVYKGSADIPNNGSYVFQSIHTGLIFDFGVSDSNDDYKISSLSFTNNGGQENAVPEPGTVGLLGLGLVGGIYARRKKAA